MPKLEVEISEKTDQMVRSFEAVARKALGRQLSFDMYLHTVLRQGVQSMLTDVVGEAPDDLLRFILSLHQSNPETVSSFISATIEIAQREGKAKKGSRRR